MSKPLNQTFSTFIFLDCFTFSTCQIEPIKLNLSIYMFIDIEFGQKYYALSSSLLPYRLVVNSLLYDKLLPRESSRPSVSFCCMGGLKRLSELLKFSYTSLINLPLQNILYELYISAFVFI